MSNENKVYYDKGDQSSVNKLNRLWIDIFRYLVKTNRQKPYCRLYKYKIKRTTTLT